MLVDKEMTNKFLFIFVLGQMFLISTSCTRYDQRLEIIASNSPQVLLLHKKTNQINVHSMGIHCYEKLDGEAQIILMLNGSPYKATGVKNKVDFKWDEDWERTSQSFFMNQRC